MLALLPAHPAELDIGWRMAICGLGFGLFQTPNNRAMLSSAPRERSGGASGMLSTARLLGQTLGAALVAMIFGLAPRAGTTLTLVVARRLRGGGRFGELSAHPGHRGHRPAGRMRDLASRGG